MEYSKEIADIVLKYLDDKEINYSFLEIEGSIRFEHSLECELQVIHFIIQITPDGLYMFANCPLGPGPKDPESMAKIVEYISRINYVIEAGCFEIAFDTGLITFREYIDCDHMLPSKEVIDNTYTTVVETYEQYGDGIPEILFHNKSPKKVFDVWNLF